MDKKDESEDKNKSKCLCVSVCKIINGVCVVDVPKEMAHSVVLYCCVECVVVTTGVATAVNINKSALCN